MTTLIFPTRELPHQAPDAHDCPCHTQGMTHLIVRSLFGFFDMGLVSKRDPRIRSAQQRGTAVLARHGVAALRFRAQGPNACRSTQSSPSSPSPVSAVERRVAAKTVG